MEYTNSQMVSYIKEKVHDKTARAILYRRFIDGATYERLAEEFNYSTRQIIRIVAKYVSEMSLL